MELRAALIAEGNADRPLVDVLGRLCRSLSELTIEIDSDADDPTPRRNEISDAFEARSSPGWVSVVPIHETEAWLLVDESAIRELVGNPQGPLSLDLVRDTKIALTTLALRNA